MTAELDRAKPKNHSTIIPTTMAISPYLCEVTNCQGLVFLGHVWLMSMSPLDEHHNLSSFGQTTVPDRETDLTDKDESERPGPMRPNRETIPAFLSPVRQCQTT